MTSRILSVLIAGSFIAFLSFGVRSTLGHFNDDMTVHTVVTSGWQFFGSWSVASTITFGGFSLALALQNLFWGITQPFSGGLADRFGPVRIMFLGAVLYCLGVASMAFVPTNGWLYLGAGLLTGVGISFTSFNLVIAAFTRLIPGPWRGLAMGLGTAMGSAGQMVLNPFVAPLIGLAGWQGALILLGGLCLLVIPAALVLRGSDHSAVKNEGRRQSVREAMGEAFSNRSYIFLVFGFFVCGFHLAFITVHMPRYLGEELALGPQVSGWFLSLVGGFNIIGSLLAGYLAQNHSRPLTLALIYAARGLAIAAFLWALSVFGAHTWIVYTFGAFMGLLWLATVPPTTGVVAHMFGLSHMALLYGFAFFSHQVGSFVGVVMAGWFYAVYDTYVPIWYASIILSFVAFALHLPIRDVPVPRLKAAQAGLPV